MNQFECLEIPLIKDSRGIIGVVDNLLPFEIKRVFFIYDVTSARGGHRHHKTSQAMICLKGSVEVYMNNGSVEDTITLSTPDKCLIIKPEDWHTMDNFSSDCVLLIMASHHYDKADYIEAPYNENSL